MSSKHKVLIGLLVLVPVVSAFVYISISKSQKNNNLKEAVPQIEPRIILYVPSSDDLLEQKTTMIKDFKDSFEMAKALIEKLKEFNVIPRETRLLHFAGDDEGTLYLNFSKDLIECQKDFSEVLVVYSIVNTFLANLKKFSRVQLLIEGEALQTFGGVLYTYLPLDFNEEIVEEE
ncbi:MAG: GerMN domain-containing protein [Deltaproteobacteria bacterium]|nr:GerMN domain-containing protein [Deltaproteobacteria bacterium]